MAQQLPRWVVLKPNFPAFEAGTVAQMVGGKVKTNYDLGVFKNFCCIRVSRALNLSGHPIPFFKDTGPKGQMTPAVSSGQSGAWHIFRVRSLSKYMISKYGAPDRYISANYQSGMSGRKGIVVYEVEGWDDASGHADCWENSRCLWEDYGSKAKSILFWEAP